MTVFLTKTYGCVEKASICVLVSAETGVSLLHISLVKGNGKTHSRAC